jgi:SecD/SecF fusion protein
MQNKGFIKFVAILFALVCLYHLSFTYVTTRVEKRANEYAHGAETERLSKILADGNQVREQYLYDSIAKAKDTYYRDSMSNQIVYNLLIRKYTYKEVKERELNLGLDLKGGMNVTLEVSVIDIIRGLSGNSQNPTFVAALNLAREKQKDSQEDFVPLFGQAFEEVDPNAQLASIFITEFKGQINYNSTNEEVLAIIKQETDAAIDRTFNILRTRIDRFGVAQPNIQKLQTAGRILVELPGIKEPARVRKLLQGTAQLEFWETYNFSELYNYFQSADQKLLTVLEKERILDDVADDSPLAETGEEIVEETITEEITESVDTTAQGLLDQVSDSLDINQESMSAEEIAKTNPLFAYLRPNLVQNQQGNYGPAASATVGYAEIKDTAMINNMLKRVMDVFPRDMKLAWKIKPEKQTPDYLELVALKVTSRDGSAALGGDVIVDARQDYDQNTGRVEVLMNMNSEGARVWKRLTGDNIGRQVAVVLDGFVYSAPNVSTEIPNGSSSISGNFEVDEGKDLANILKAGKLPAPARIVEEAVVGPSLGKVAVNDGLMSFIIAFILVLLYMVLYYNRAGWVADLALLTNIFFLFGVLASLGAVLTLPGIAGIVLTLGMAVDANVIIYERIKEEVRAGKGMKLAISDGYKNAYSAIIDGNVTTLLTGIVLYTFGSGPVQGFATTLIIGILSSLFSAIFISRLVFSYFLDRNKSISFGNKLTINTLAGSKIDFLAMRKKAYVLSIAIIVIGIASLAIRGLNYGVDFSGGRTYVIRFDQPVNTNDMRNSLEVEFDQQPEVKTFGPSSQVKITTKYLIDDDNPSVDSLIQRKIFTALKPYFNDQNIDYRHFIADTDEDKLIGILSSQKVGPTIADDIRNRAVMAIVFALIVIFVYIAIRFKKWQYGLSGVIALFHDTLITIGLFSIFYNILPFNLEIDQAFIAAILTIIGYSINDTVIIFDRIREYVFLHPKKSLATNINDGLNSTLARTLNTSGTTLVVLLIIFIFGGEVIRGFTFALLVGILVGTYSSLFVASPVAYDLLSGKKKDNQKSK